MMWCTACGAPLPTPARFCSRCGNTNGQEGAARSSSWAPDPQNPCEAGRAMAGLQIWDAEIRQLIAGTTLAGMDTTGEQQLFEVDGPRDLHVWIACVVWSNGEREVRRTRRYETPWWQDHLFGRQRLSIEDWGEGYRQIDLDQAYLDGDRTLRIGPVSEYELDARSGACVRCALSAAGATAMGTRQEVLGVCDEDRHGLCATFPRDAIMVPIVAFALTRVAPLLNGASVRSA